MTNTVYEIQVIQLDREERMREIQQAVAAELREVGLHQTVSITLTEATPTPDVPSLAVYLGSQVAATDAGVALRIESAFNEGLVVFPVIDDLAEFSVSIPAMLASVNGWEWAGEDPARRLARVLLEELGIEDRQRRVFISHKRDDGLGAAEQLHDRLSHMGFVPFIDRFAIRSGRQVQEEIADALEDHAFLLLLETPLASTSEWVFDEVDYALSHTMGTLILQWPGDPEPVPGSNGLPRVPLRKSDLVIDEHGYDTLTDAALDAVVARIEAAHAQGLVRRRRMLIRSIEEAASAAGCSSVPLPAWRVSVECDTRSTILGVTPRLPTAEDLQLLDLARSESSDGSSAVLVHSARVLRERLRAHLAWAAGGRDLVVMPENAIGGQWTGP
ncbi:MAG: toll/interleukin-1 receptor domain-containing protein [Solirubrobacterales bacterium]